MRLLFAAGIRFHAAAFPSTPIDIAIDSGLPAALEFVLDQKIGKVNSCPSDITPLWRVLQRRNVPMVRMLLAHGADRKSRLRTHISNEPLSPVAFADSVDDFA
jgi:hypothetical protein